MMRIDVGVWTKRKIAFKQLENEESYESHWLRFERNMGEIGLN